MVRLPWQPGKTKVRFSYRAVSPASAAFGFRAIVQVGFEGGRAAPFSFSPEPTGTAEMLTFNAAPVLVSPVAVMEVPLPDVAMDNVLVYVAAPGSSACGGLVRTSGGGMLIDDLRTE
jgi:hypothetical protein